MRNSAEIQLIGYVYQDAKHPNEQDYPNWVTFKLCVNKKYKDKNGQDQQDTSWFECKSNSETTAKLIKLYIKDKSGVWVRGIPKAKAYTTSSGTAEASIEVLVTEFNVLTTPREAETDKTTYGTATLNKGANPPEPSGNGKYTINSGKKSTLEVELRDDEIPF